MYHFIWNLIEWLLVHLAQPSPPQWLNAKSKNIWGGHGLEERYENCLDRKGEGRVWEKDAGLGKFFEDKWKWKCYERYDGNLRLTNSERQES